MPRLARRSVLLAALGALARPSASAGAEAARSRFDRYQLIMWQEHTPEQMTGLRALGFTATKLRGTGGEIDPAALARATASGLPWYVENVATDFYAPYHRYAPGRAVTWLFDAAKARRRADPGNAAVFEREPSLSDPVWSGQVAARLERLVRSQSQYAPLYYNLADEAGIGDLSAAWDADVGASSLAGMRRWLATQYASLAALNAQWGTAYGGWDEVVPELTDAAVRRTDDNYSAWSDFKAWMDVAFAEAVRRGTAAVHRGDPAALAGLEGAQVPGWGGYDYGLLADAVDVMEIYDAGNALDLARAFNPALIPLRTSFDAGPQDVHAAWHNLLHGGRGTVVWDERDDVVAADGSPGPRGKELAALVAAIDRAAPYVLGAEPDLDPVAVLYSQASFRVRWILDQRARGTDWAARDAAREDEDNTWRAARRVVLARLAQLGVQPRLLSAAMVEAGALRGSDLRVLILPHAIALSQAEVDEITAFARRGGTVLADTEPGLFDGHGKRRRSPALDGVAAVPEALLLQDAETSGLLAAVAGLLRDAGVTPRARLAGPDGQLAVGVEARWLRKGGLSTLCLQAMQPWRAPPQVVLTLDPPAVLSSVMGAVERGPGATWTVPLDPVTPTILRVGG